MNAPPFDNNIAPLSPAPKGYAGDTPAERYAAYLDYAFSPHSHRRQYALTVSLLVAGIVLSVGAYLAASRFGIAAYFGVAAGAFLAGWSLARMHRMVRRAQAYARRKRLAQRGELVIGYLTQCSDALLHPGTESALPCRILFSFQPEVGADRAYMRYLAGQVASLKNKIPRGDMDKQYVAALASEPRALANRRYLLPLSFTDGSTVYLADLFVSRSYLPGGYLYTDTLACLAEPGANGGVELLPEWLLDPASVHPVLPAARTAPLPPDPNQDDAPLGLG